MQDKNLLSRRHFLETAGVAAVAGALYPAAARAAQAKYKVCIIGDTAHGGYGHGLHMALVGRPEVDIVGLADPDEAGRAKHAKECGAPRTYADYREMLEKEKPNLVVVGPRMTVRHREYVLACAEAGAHGFMEKPLCTDLEEADAMVAAIAAKNLKWALAFNVRVAPTVQHVRHMVMEEGLIGSLLEMRGRGKEDHRSGGEDLIVLGAHVFDMMAWIMGGPPAWCFSDILQGGRPARPEDVHEATEELGPIVGDSIQAMFGFTGDVRGHFASVPQPKDSGTRFGLDLCGSKGVVAIRFGSMPQIAWLDSPAWGAEPNGAAWKPVPGTPEFVVNDGPRDGYRPIVDDLFACIEEDREPATSLQHSVHAQEMIQAVFASQVAGGRVTLPLAGRAHPLKGWAGA